MKGAFYSTTPLLFLLTLISPSVFASAATPPASFIRSGCKNTLYPEVCMQCLAPYALVVRGSMRRLAYTALAVSAEKAGAASASTAKLSAAVTLTTALDVGPVEDCSTIMSDSADRLRQAVKQMKHMGRPGTARFKWNLSSLKTWASAALTDQSTCADGLKTIAGAEEVWAAAIEKNVTEVTKTTSIALALLNQLGC